MNEPIKTLSLIEITELKKKSETVEGLLNAVQSNQGMVPNLIKAMVTSPSVLKAHLRFSEALSEGVLDVKLREKIALVVAAFNKNQYCLSMHTALGKSVGLSEDDVADSRHGEAPDGRTNAVLHFARSLMEGSGCAPNDQLNRLRKAGFNGAEISEIIAHISMNIFTNYFSQIMNTPLDFPKVDPG